MSSLMGAGKLFVLGCLAAALIAIANVPGVHATSPVNHEQQIVPLEIVPECSSSITGKSYWKVTNKNAADVTVGWSKVVNGDSGTYVAPGKTQEPSSDSIMATSYDASDRNNTTDFTYNGIQLGQTNARDHRDGGCAAFERTEPTIPVVECIDGRIQQNLLTTIAGNKATVKTVGGKPLCEDVTVYFSSYTMPAGYDGKGFFGNPTAYPQDLFGASDSAVLKAGTDGAVLLTVGLPDSCENIQVDVYYGPEITLVGSNGHGTQNILSDVYLKDDSGCDEQPGQGGGEPTTPPVSPPSTPVVLHPQPIAPPVQPSAGMGAGTPSGVQTDEADPALPNELPSTGAGESFVLLYAAFASMLIAYLAAHSLQRRFGRVF